MAIPINIQAAAQRRNSTSSDKVRQEIAQQARVKRIARTQSQRDLNLQIQKLSVDASRVISNPSVNFSTVTELNTFYKSLDGRVQAQLSTTPQQSINNLLSQFNKRISQYTQRADKSLSGLSGSKRDKAKARAKAASIGKQILTEAVNRIKGGQILNYNTITNYANSQVNQAEKQIKLEGFNSRLPSTVTEVRFRTDPVRDINKGIQKYTETKIVSERNEILKDIKNKLGSNAAIYVRKQGQLYNSIKKNEGKQSKLTSEQIQDQIRISELEKKLPFTRDKLKRQLYTPDPEAAERQIKKLELKLNTSLIRPSTQKEANGLNKFIEKALNPKYFVSTKSKSNANNLFNTNKVLIDKALTLGKKLITQKLTVNEAKQIIIKVIDGQKIINSEILAIVKPVNKEGKPISGNATGGLRAAGIELLPLLNKDSRTALIKLTTKKGSLTNAEQASLFLDAFSVIPITRIVSGGAKFSLNLTKIAGKIKVGNKTFKVNKVSNNKLVKYVKKINPNQVKQLIDFFPSIFRNTGLGNRSLKAFKQYLGVDETLLNKTSKDFGISRQQLYEAYLGELTGGLISIDSVLKFWSIDARADKTIVLGQKKFLQTLRGRGLSNSQALEILINLEKERQARIYSQAITLISIEYSSERLAQNLIKVKGKGRLVSSSSDAVVIAGMREGLAVLGAEAIRNDYSISVTDFILAVTLGAAASRFFSPVKINKLTKQSINKAQNKLSSEMFSKLSINKRNQYLTKIIRKEHKGIGKENVKRLLSNLNKKDKSLILKEYIKKAIVKGQNKIIPKISRVQNVKGIRQTLNLEKDFRSIMGDVLDPWEIPGDFLESNLARFQKKLRLKSFKTNVIKKKVKTISSSKTKPKTKPKTKTPKLPKFKLPKFPKGAKVRQGFKIVLFRGGKRIGKSVKVLPMARANNAARKAILKGRGNNYILISSGKTKLKDVSQIMYKNKFVRKNNRIFKK